MRAICPVDANHERFITTAHVKQEWIVDSKGEFMEEITNLETTHPPSTDNIWTCSECGAKAVHQEENN